MIEMDNKGFSLNIPVFILAFCIGILYIYLVKPAYKRIVKYPTPETCGKIIYKDKSNNCFVYDFEKVTCTNDKKPQPVNI